MRYLLACPCGQSIPVSRAQAGSQVLCPNCGRGVEVPTIRGLANLPVAEEELAEGTVGKRTRPRWSTSRRILATACFAVMLLCGAAAAMLLMARTTYNPGWTLQGELEYGDVMISQYKPAELWDVWSAYRQEGLGQQNPPEHVLMQRQLESWDPYMYTAFGLAAAGLIGWLTTIFTAPRNKAPKP